MLLVRYTFVKLKFFLFLLLLYYNFIFIILLYEWYNEVKMFRWYGIWEVLEKMFPLVNLM